MPTSDQPETSKNIAEKALAQLLEMAARRIQEVEAELPTGSSVSASSIRRLLRAARLRDIALLDLGRFIASASTEGLRVSFTEDAGTSGVLDTDYVLDYPFPENGWQTATVDLCISDDAGDGKTLSAVAAPRAHGNQHEDWGSPHDQNPNGVWRPLSEVLPEAEPQPRAPIVIPDGFLQPKVAQLAAEEGSTEGALFYDVFQTYPKPEVYGDAAQVMSEMREVMIWAPNVWLRLLTEQVGHLLNVSVPLLRHVQEMMGTTTPELKSWFSKLTAISRAMKPGYVYGLSHDHTSEGRESWLEAANRAYAEMQVYVEGGKTANQEPQGKMKQALEVLDACKTGNPDTVLQALDKHANVPLHKYHAVLMALKRYKDKLAGNPQYDRVMQVADKKASKVEDDEEATTFYEHVALTRGRRAVLVGGSPQARITERIRSHLQLSELEWIEISPNAIRQVAAKQESGTLDFVFLLQEFISHKHYQSLKRGPAKTGNLFVLVPNGYGLKSVCEALTESFRVSERIE